MTTFNFSSYEVYDRDTGSSTTYTAENATTNLSGAVTDNGADTVLTVGEVVDVPDSIDGGANNFIFVGLIDTVDGSGNTITLLAVRDLVGGTNNNIYLFNPTTVANTVWPPTVDTTVLSANAGSGYTPICFAPGTLIATPGGACLVEKLGIGDRVLTAAGEAVPVKWVGRQTARKLLAGARMQPVRIGKGALGGGLPQIDLTVTADHGMVVDGLVINASALVNGSSIDWVPMAELPERVTYYHVETEHHDVILANGAPAETFVDIPGRMAFDNYAEYIALHGAERIVPELTLPRITSSLLLPEAIRAQLRIGERGIDLGEPLSA